MRAGMQLSHRAAAQSGARRQRQRHPVNATKDTKGGCAPRNIRQARYNRKLPYFGINLRERPEPPLNLVDHLLEHSAATPIFLDYIAVLEAKRCRSRAHPGR